MSKKQEPERRQFNVNMLSERDELMVADFRAFVKAETRLSFPQAVLEAMERYMKQRRAEDPRQGF
jgi:hypothetical protein